MAYYFVSDVHLGSRAVTAPEEVEIKFVNWLDMVAKDADAIFLVGDIFDFWFEYKYVVPKGFTRVLGKLAQLTQQGIEVHFMTGNHDIWTFGYLETECGVKVHTDGEIFTLLNKQIYVGHGNELKECQTSGYRLMNSFFHNKIAQCLFSKLIHPDIAMWFGLKWSWHNRIKHKPKLKFKGDADNIVKSIMNIHKNNYLDYCVLGHFHTPISHQCKLGPKIVIMGDWIYNPSYCVLNESGLELKTF